jgi:long-chain acyl-CoA synthetase
MKLFVQNGIVVKMEERIWHHDYDIGVPTSLKYPKIPVFKLLENTSKKYPLRDAIVFIGKRIKYSELLELTDRFASSLINLGIKKGDRVALYLPNTPHMIIAFYGSLKAGAIAVCTNPLYTERELEYQLIDSGADCIVTLNLKPILSRVKALKDKIPIKHIIVGSICDFLPFPRNLLYPIVKKGELEAIPYLKGYHRFSRLLKDNYQTVQADVQPDDIALLQYTGGTTGISKGAALTHSNLVSNALQFRSWGNEVFIDGNETILTVLPCFHIYALTICMNLGVMIGGTILLLSRFNATEVLEAIRKYSPTIFPAVPTIYTAIANHPDARNYEVDSIKLCLSGGAPLPHEVLDKFEKATGLKIIEAYGLSEASPATHVNPFTGRREIGTVGLPLPDTDAKVVDLESGEKELAIGERGELIVKGPQVMKGYWNRPDETSHTLRNGWLFTGDIATMNQNGYFSIVDRKKEMIISGGYNVYPREVEDVLYEHPKILEAAVIGVPDSYKGERIKAFTVLKSGEEATESEIIVFCKERLAPFKVPKVVEFRDSLPKSNVGKVLRRVLREEEIRKAKQ